jgi:hypothetical protein
MYVINTPLHRWRQNDEGEGCVPIPKCHTIDQTSIGRDFPLPPVDVTQVTLDGSDAKSDIALYQSYHLRMAVPYVCARKRTKTPTTFLSR